jgi:medium-chain acyl-[acyl-carrier-protein] hydrolase
MGALVAFEIVRHLRKRFLTLPCHLFVSGFRAPHLPDPRPLLYQMAKEDLVDELRRLNGMAPELLEDSELLDLVLAPLRADLQVAQTYRHSSEAPLGCPITAYGGTADPDVDRSDLEPWRAHTLSEFAVKILPGDHFFPNAALPLLLTDLKTRLLASLG